MAEGNGLLNRRRGKTSTEGSNPSLSATACLRGLPQRVLHRRGVSMGSLNPPDITPHALLPFQLNPEPAIESLTTCGGLPLMAQPYWSLGLPQKSVVRPLRLTQRKRG